MKILRFMALTGMTAMFLAVARPATAAAPSSAFTFQGRLVAGGSPANGLFDLRLMLFDASAGGAQVGTTLTNVNVGASNGLFTTLVDFGSAPFDGTTYWVDVAVRPGGTSHPFRTLAPRQRLAGLPYALHAATADRAATAGTATTAGIATNALTAASAPWSGLTGVPPGFSDGIDQDTTYIAGEGLQLVGTEFRASFAGSGSASTAARSDHTHAGSDIVSGTVADGFIAATIARDAEVFGLVKSAAGPGSGLDADTLDGYESLELWRLGGNPGLAGARPQLGTTDNSALEFLANNARVLRLEPTSTSPNLVAGYRGNHVAPGTVGATIGGGGTPNDGTGTTRTNRISAHYGTIAGGFGHGIDAVSATIGGGRNNAIKSSATNAVIPGGSGAVAVNVGQLAHASGSFSAPGDAQTSLYVLRAVTLNNTTTNLLLDGTGTAMTVPSGARWAYDALIIGSTSGAASAAFQLRGAIRNQGGTTTLLPGAPAIQSLGNDGAAGWTVTAFADDSQDALILRVTGPSIGTVRWVASVRVVELSF